MTRRIYRPNGIVSITWTYGGRLGQPSTGWWYPLVVYRKTRQVPYKQMERRIKRRGKPRVVD